MTPRQTALKALAECYANDDTEEAHVNADNALRALLKTLGFMDVVEAYDKVEKWYA